MRKELYLFFIALLITSCNSTGNKAQINDDANKADSLKVEVEKFNYSVTKRDVAIFDSIINYATSNNLSKLKISAIGIEVVKLLLNIPYVGGTLEKDSTEQLVINLRELDCVTLVENVVAISNCIKSGKTSFSDYCNMLKKNRYRDGKIEGYPSRLHYTTDWLLNNKKKGFIKIVSNDFGNTDFDPTVYFMTKNASKYKKLANNPGFVNKMAQYEKAVSKTKLKFITKDKIDELKNHIQDGDIIAFSTTIKGLDILHVGIAKFKNGNLHFYHASSLQKKVILSKNTISEYTKGKKNIDGILVARLVDF